MKGLKWDKLAFASHGDKAMGWKPEPHITREDAYFLKLPWGYHMQNILRLFI